MATRTIGLSVYDTNSSRERDSYALYRKELVTSSYRVFVNTALVAERRPFLLATELCQAYTIKIIGRALDRVHNSRRPIDHLLHFVTL